MDFLLIKYDVAEERTPKSRRKAVPVARSVRVFVGQVIEKFANRLQMKFLRPYNGRRSSFHFPHRDDLDYVTISAVVRLLPVPTHTRGVFSWSEPPY